MQSVNDQHLLNVLNVRAIISEQWLSYTLSDYTLNEARIQTQDTFTYIQLLSLKLTFLD